MKPAFRAYPDGELRLPRPSVDADALDAARGDKEALLKLAGRAAVDHGPWTYDKFRSWLNTRVRDHRGGYITEGQVFQAIRRGFRVS